MKLLVNVDDATVRPGGQEPVVPGDVDGSAPDAAVVVKPVQTILSLQVPDVDLASNCQDRKDSGLRMEWGDPCTYLVWQVLSSSLEVSK